MRSIKNPIKLRTRTDAWRAMALMMLRSPLVIAAISGYLIIALATVIYLDKAPVFSSEMALVLPGSGSSSNFSIEDVGQANAQTKSPFSGGSFNPRVNYKEIIKSRDVVADAAASVGFDPASFGIPRVKLTEQTSILTITIQGGSADMAQNKAWAIYDAFQQRLESLRADESLRHSRGIEDALQQYASVLNSKRQAVLAFQERSLLVSREQFEQMTRSLAALRDKLSFAESEFKRREQVLEQLTQDLGVSPGLAGQAFALNTDSQFLSYLRELDDSAALMSTYNAHWGTNHPKVQAEQQRLKAAQDALYSRSVELVGQTVADSLHTMNLTASSGRAQLFAELVETSALYEGDRAQIQSMQLTEQAWQDRLRIYARESAELDRLEREAKLAEAVYTSAAARLDAGKADVFASYPVVQMLTPPSSPRQQKSPNIAVAIAGATFGIFFITLGVLIAWQRHYLIKQLLKRS